MTTPNLTFIAAPMVDQSDLPFRALVSKYGATLCYSQMLDPNKLLNDQEYLEFHQRDLQWSDPDRLSPLVIQLCGNDPDLLVKAGRKLENYCEGIDLNLGCPQLKAKENHFGAYLLGQKDWPLVQNLVSSMSHSFTVPTSVKMRLCQPFSNTLSLAQNLEACGAAWVTLHARTVSARRRRAGPAFLEQVKTLKEGLKIPVISNGNVRSWDDIPRNLALTGADGLMVGETLLCNPCLFEQGPIPDPFAISGEYIDLCRTYTNTARLQTIQAHIKHFFEPLYRQAWHPRLIRDLAAAGSLETIEETLQRGLILNAGAPTSRTQQMEDIQDFGVGQMFG